MSSNYHDVLRFHQKLDLPVRDEVIIPEQGELQHRLDFMNEELDEFRRAYMLLYANDGSNGPRSMNIADKQAINTMANIADALVDLVYVAMGTAIQLGLPWQQLWDKVQKANMQKIRELDNETGHKLGVKKPAGWNPPDQANVLRRFTRTVQEVPTDVPLRCKHGLHIISDVCDICADELIMGSKPSARGQRSGTETGRFSSSKSQMTEVARLPQSDSFPDDTYVIIAARVFELPLQNVTKSMVQFIARREKDVASGRPKLDDAELREAYMRLR